MYIINQQVQIKWDWNFASHSHHIDVSSVRERREQNTNPALSVHVVLRLVPLRVASLLVLYFPRMILREAPKFCPDCVAILFVPACKPITASPALRTSSLNSRRFSSAGLGPRKGPRHSGCLYDCKHKQCWGIGSGFQNIEIILKIIRYIMFSLGYHYQNWTKWK